MPSPEKKRNIQDFFTSYKKPPTFPTQSSVPQKRPSPTPEDEAECTVLRETRLSAPKTPSKQRVKKYSAAPQRPIFSPVTPRSGTLPFRSPGPTNSAHSTPTSVRKTLKRFEEQIQAELEAEKPSPKKQTTLNFNDIPPKATQSVVKEGKVIAVRDSDEDDTDSLASLDELFGFKKKDDDDTELSSPPDVDEDAREKDRIEILNLFKPSKPQQRPGFQRLRNLYAQDKVRKFDISKLLDDHFEAGEREESVQKSRDQYESSKAELKQERYAELHKDLLGSLITEKGGDEEDMARLMSAVSRTEALTTERSFSFFGLSGMTDWDRREPPEIEFPEDTMPLRLWQSGDNDARSRLYLSGYLGELAARNKLSDTTLNWTFEVAVTETDDYLRSAYAECLKRGSSSWSRINLSAGCIQRCFQTLGAREDNFKSGHEIKSRHQPMRKDEIAPSSKYLLSVLDLFQTLCQDMDFLALGKLASVACRLALDAEVMSYSNICSHVEKLLSTLLDIPEKEVRIYVGDYILSDIGKTLHDPVLQAGLLSHLLPTSETAAQLRLMLAHAFLLGNDTVPSSCKDPFSTSLVRLSKHVYTSPGFDTRYPSKVDYIALRARTHILDIAISDGSAPTFATPQERTPFNKSVDALANSIKRTFVRISDAGASHMSRTEAKDALHALYYRLLFAVRTEPQPKKNIFDAGSGKMRDGEEYREEGRGKDFMVRFLAKEKRGRREEDEGRRETPELPSQPSPSEKSESDVLIRRQLELSQ